MIISRHGFALQFRLTTEGQNYLGPAYFFFLLTTDKAGSKCTLIAKVVVDFASYRLCSCLLRIRDTLRLWRQENQCFEPV